MPWLITAWLLGAASALPMAASSFPALAVRLPTIPSAAWLLVSGLALFIVSMLPPQRVIRLLGLPAAVAGGIAAWQAWACTPLGTGWSLGLLGVAALCQVVAGPLAQAAAHLMVLVGVAGLSLPLLGWSPDAWQRVAAVGFGLLALEFALSSITSGYQPIALGLAHGPRQIRRWVLASRRVLGIHLGLQPLLRAFPWVVASSVLLACGVSSMTTIRVAEQGVLLHAGAPVAVLPPGLHVHAPWPWGQVVRVECGVEHRLSLSGADIPGASGTPDDPSGQVVDRQWHRSHGREAFFLTAADSGLGDRRGVRLAEIVNADLVIHWRVAAGDEAAIAAALRIDEPTRLLASLARQWVQSVFAGETPAGLLGADRASLAERMRRSLERELARLGTGLEVTAISCEAIHPPLAATAAFLAVQAAEREANGAVAVARIRRETLLAEAQIQIQRIAHQAAATASEALSEANVRQRETAAQAVAWRLAPEAIALEHRITALTTGDDEGRTLTLIDHRIQLPVGVGVDLTAPMRPRHVR